MVLRIPSLNRGRDAFEMLAHTQRSELLSPLFQGGED